MGIEFRDSRGRKISEKQWMNDLEKAVHEQAQEAAFPAAERAAKEAILRVRCPEHGESVRNLRSSRQGDGLKFRWDACCEKLTEAAQASLD